MKLNIVAIIIFLVTGSVTTLAEEIDVAPSSEGTAAAEDASVTPQPGQPQEKSSIEEETEDEDDEPDCE